VPAFTAAIEAHQRRITEAILEHALEICREKKVTFSFLVMSCQLHELLSLLIRFAILLRITLMLR
jgi:hypothetical protein